MIQNDWKTANVVPIFKKAEKNRPENYHPVPLTKGSDTLRILTDAQHGFRKRCSCETQLLLTIQELAKNIDNKGQVDIII